MDAPPVGACARRIAAASLNAKAKESLPVERVDHAAWRRPSLRARRFHIKPLAGTQAQHFLLERRRVRITQLDLQRGSRRSELHTQVVLAVRLREGG